MNLRFSRNARTGGERNDEFGMTLYKNDLADLPWELTLDNCDGAAAYFRTRQRAVWFAEAIAERGTTGLKVRELVQRLQLIADASAAWQEHDKARPVLASRR